MITAASHGVDALEILYYGLGIVGLLGGAAALRSLWKITKMLSSIMGQPATPWSKRVPSYLEQIEAQGERLAEHATEMAKLTAIVTGLTSAVTELTASVSTLHSSIPPLADGQGEMLRAASHLSAQIEGVESSLTGQLKAHAASDQESFSEIRTHLLTDASIAAEHVTGIAAQAAGHLVEVATTEAAAVAAKAVTAAAALPPA